MRMNDFNKLLGHKFRQIGGNPVADFALGEVRLTPG